LSKINDYAVFLPIDGIPFHLVIADQFRQKLLDVAVIRRQALSLDRLRLPPKHTMVIGLIAQCER
jgi:hypothetical protein